MGTVASVTFVDQGRDLVKFYVQCDGYIEGFGHELAKWLLRHRIGNGIVLGADNYGFCNGVGCLAAQFIADFKNGPGYLYMDYIDASNKWNDYNYKVMIDYDDVGTRKLDDVTQIIVTNWESPKVIFSGTPTELFKYKEPDEEDDQ